MENKNTNEFQELEEMRAQMQQYKDYLEHQIEVNTDLLMTQVKKNSKIVRTNGTEVFIAAMLAIYPVIVYSRMYGLTRLLTVFSIVLLLADGIFNYWVAHMVRGDDMSDCKVSDALAAILKVKRINRVGITLESLMYVIMVIWISYETLCGPNFSSFSSGSQTRVIVGLLVGIILGVIISFNMYRKHTRAIDEIVESLEGIKKGNDMK